MSEVVHIPQLRFSEFSGEWEEKPYGENYRFLITNSFSRDKLNYDFGEVKNIHYGDIHTKFKTLFDMSIETVPFINDDVDISRIDNDNYCQVGDLVVADASEDYGDIGKTIEIVNLDLKKTLAGLHTFLVRPMGNSISIGFMGNLLKSWKVRKQVMTVAQGSKVLGLSKTNLSKIKISLPTKPEQQKIAAFLTEVDNKIEQLSKKQELLGEYKKGAMQQIFSQAIRFKADDGSDFPDWKENKVDEFMEVTRGQVLAVPEMRQVESEIFKYPVYSSQTKNNGLTGYYTDYLFEDCITWTTDGANAGDVNYRAGKFYCTNVCGVLRSKKGYANLCIAQILNSVSRRYVSYVGNPKLMNNVMEKIKISIPSSINEQTKIANFLSSVDSKIEEVGKQLDESKQFKKALLQKMFV